MTKPQAATSSEEQLKILQKHFGALVMTVKQLKTSVDALNKQMEAIKTEEVKDIMKTQKVINEVIAEHTDAIKHLEIELVKEQKKTKSSKEQKKSHQEGVKDETLEKNIGTSKHIKKCRYFNRGFCKYRNRCKYFHPQDICEKYLLNQKCEVSDCAFRHPKQCKWTSTMDGCRRGLTCEYLHVTPVHEHEMYPCEGCKDVWTNLDCVKEHIVKGRKCYLCLNCDEWIQDKAKIFDEGWALLDGAGQLRTNI